MLRQVDSPQDILKSPLVLVLGDLLHKELHSMSLEMSLTPLVVVLIMVQLVEWQLHLAMS